MEPIKLNFPNNSPKVAVWGSYLWGNFGDDVMAVMICQHLKQLGLSPVAYKLDDKLASMYEINTDSDIKSLLTGAAACIIGGGGLLCPSTLMEREWELLYRDLSLTSIPLHVCSVGGDGTDEPHFLTLNAMRVLLLPNLKSATVRLEPDVYLFDKLSVHCKYYPDIVLASPHFFPVKNHTLSASNKLSKSFSVIINLHKSPDIEKFYHIFRSILPILGVNIKYLKTHLSWLQPNEPPLLDYEFLPQDSETESCQYESIEKVRDIILSSDLVISSKLHVGVFSYSFGVPFLSLNGPKKASSFIEQIGATSCRFAGKLFSLKLLILILKARREKMKAKSNNLKNNFPLETMSSSPLGHFQEIDNFLSNLFPSSYKA